MRVQNFFSHLLAPFTVRSRPRKSVRIYRPVPLYGALLLPISALNLSHARGDLEPIPWEGKG